MRCSFCGKSKSQVETLIAGPGGVYICDECIRLSSDMVKTTSQNKQKQYIAKQMPTPKKIYNHLNNYVVGQENTKKALCVAVYNHYKRVLFTHNKIQSKKPIDEFVELQKSNILLIGPTGTGKTYMAQVLAKFLDVPFTIVDATALTEAGYVGEDVENTLFSLFQNANEDMKRAEKGIIYIDEIDKIAKKSENLSLTRDVSGEGVQQALLKILEGTVANIPKHKGRKHPGEQLMEMNTKDILFIVSGAFVGLENIISKRTSRIATGFNSDFSGHNKDIDKIIQKVQPEDLVKFGLIPEFIGRVPIITTVHDLTKNDLTKILVEPRNSLIKQYQKMFLFDGFELEFTENAIKEIATQTLKTKTGARGLRSVMENVLGDYMFELPGRNDIKKIVITEKDVLKKNSLDKKVAA